MGKSSQLPSFHEGGEYILKKLITPFLMTFIQKWGNSTRKTTTN